MALSAIQTSSASRICMVLLSSSSPYLLNHSSAHPRISQHGVTASSMLAKAGVTISNTPVHTCGRRPRLLALQRHRTWRCMRCMSFRFGNSNIFIFAYRYQANVFISDNGRARLTGFGFALTMSAGEFTLVRDPLQTINLDR